MLKKILAKLRRPPIVFDSKLVPGTRFIWQVKLAIDPSDLLWSTQSYQPHAIIPGKFHLFKHTHYVALLTVTSEDNLKYWLLFAGPLALRWAIIPKRKN